MASLHAKVQTALDEGRILILATQVLIGFEYRSFFEPRFEGLPGWAQRLRLLTLCLMLLAFALLALPASYHRIVAGGDDRGDVSRFASATHGIALLPFGIALGVSVGFAVYPATRSAAAFAVAAALVTAGALGAWYAYPLLSRASGGPPRKEREMAPTDLSSKIKHVLTEDRMVLPGAQALLGFQLAVTLMASFEKTSAALQGVHLAALAAVAVAVILLMTPAAYHRIVDHGEETERFYRVASAFVLAGMVAVAVGLAADLYVVAEKVLDSPAVAGAVAAAALATCLGLWFGLTLALRARRSRAGVSRRAAAAARS